jgi:hypothetical protein
MGGVYVGPYNFTGPTGSLQLICDDFGHEVYVGESWKAAISTLPSSGLLFSTGQFSGSTLTQYEEAAYLAQAIFALGPVNSSNAATIGYMQYALWDIFDPSASLQELGLSSLDSANPVGHYFGLALANAGSGNYSDVVIYTPVGGTQTLPGQTNPGLPQEYFGIIPTPEPSSLALLVSGMLALMLLVIRRGRA